MPILSTISTAHTKKLDHPINEIRLRALENIISKLKLGFECDCNAVKKELFLKLFNWFSIEPIIEEEKVLDLLIQLMKYGNGNYLNSFGILRFQNELRDLRAKLNSKWHDKLNLMEEIALNPEKFIENFDETPTVICDSYESISNTQQQNGTLESNNATVMSPLDSSIPFDLTMNYGDGTVISRRSESSVKWLIMPWQLLASSDKGVLAALEDSLSNSIDVAVKMQSCQFITNIMLQDFPAEVFLHRPNTVNILLSLLQEYKNEHNPESQNLIIAILKALDKLTRSLRFRIYYYCDPSIAHKAQKILMRNLENEGCILTQERDSPEGELRDQNYDQYQQTRPTSNHTNLIDNADDAVLRMQQMYIPFYCTETLINILKLLSIPNDPICPLKLVRYIADLAYELLDLFITSVMPTVWFCNDNVALKIHQNVKILLELLSEILDYFGEFNSVDYNRITYIYFLWITVKLISNIVPLELADRIIPKKMKLSICTAIMDAPLYLLYPSVHVTLQEYARKFHGTVECETVKLLDETRLVIKSMKAAIQLMKDLRTQTYSEELKTIYLSKLSLLYHKNLKLIKKFINVAQNKNAYKLNKEEKEMTTKVLLSMLAHNDDDIQEAMYAECHLLVTTILDAKNCRSNWKHIIFLFDSTVLTEIICHGTTHENQKIKDMAEDILLFLLKGKVQLTEFGWSKLLEVIIPVLPLLACLSHSTSSLGKCIIKMLDPDVSGNMNLPLLEVVKGNIRLLFSPMADIRNEIICRLLWLLSQEENSMQKLPRLTSLHDLPLGSICVFDKQTCTKRSEGNYQKNALISVLEMLQSPNVEPKMKKSALVQVSVMLSDPMLHKIFIAQNGLPIILDIFSKALIERDFVNYPDSVISVVTILKLLVSSESSIRMDLSDRIDIYYNIMRSLFLYPNNESLKMDAAHVLALLLYNEFIIKLPEKTTDNPYSISLPCLVTTNMRLPFACKAHWKTSFNRRSDISILHRSNPIALGFIRQFWAWEWNGGQKVLWKKWDDVNDPMITETLMIRETEFACLLYTSLHNCSQQQLFNIQNSVTHKGVTCAMDYLVIYLKLSKLLNHDNLKNILQLSWANTFERFLQSYPTNNEDHELFVNVLNFLNLYIKLASTEESKWLCKAIKNMMKSLGEWLHSSEQGSENIHQAIFKLARACSMIDEPENDETKSSWISFVEFAVSNLFYGEYYNLALLDWVLSTLTYVIGKCEWKSHNDTLLSIGNALIELILSFHREGTVSFMGLTITRDCIICLNHILHQMQTHLSKNQWMKFWYQEGQLLSWLPALWKSRDPLVRASGLQLLGNLINGPHTAVQLLNAIDASPAGLCHSLLYFINAQEESCIVKEEACLALSNLIKNSNTLIFQYVDELKPRAMLSYVKEHNTYHEIAVMFSNCYMQSSLDPEISENSESEGTQMQSVTSSRSGTTVSMVPKTVYYLYNCAEDFERYSPRDSDITDNEDQMQFIATPTLISTLCLLLNNLIDIGEHEVIHEIFEHSLHKYIIGCFDDIPKTISGECNLEHYCSVIEMYTNLCTVLSKCIIHSPDFASIVTFSAEFIRHLFNLINKDLYFINTARLLHLRNQLCTEIFNFLVCLSITENQHLDSIQIALETCQTEFFVKTICNIIKFSKSDFGVSALSFFTFLLSLEMQKECEENRTTIIKDILDTKEAFESNEYWNNTYRMGTSKVLSGAKSIENPKSQVKNVATDAVLYIGADMSKVLINLFIAHAYTKFLKKSKQSCDKDVITVALTNLLCISMEAKKSAISENFPNTCLLFLKEMYVKINAMPVQAYKCQGDHGQKIHPLLQELDSIYLLMMNFMYDCTEAKQIFAIAGLADIIHKLWAYMSLNKKTLITSLKLISTFTSNCLEAAQSLPLTTVTPGVGLRKTPNSVALIHVIVQLVTKEIDNISRNGDYQKLNYSFDVLRNAIHNHECRVVISKSNLLQFFTKIHPSTTKRTKIWQIVEINCLEFLIDFTFYDEGQLSVSKATDSLEVLIHLARVSSGATRLLATSVLRNLAFNGANRPRLLGSADFLNLMLSSLKEGSLTDIEVAGSTLWSLVSNNQKGKLIIRSAGFPQCIQAALSRISLQLPTGEGMEDSDLVKMLEYVLQIITPS